MRDISLADHDELDGAAPRPVVVVRRPVDVHAAAMQRAIDLHLASQNYNNHDNHHDAGATAESEGRSEILQPLSSTLSRASTERSITTTITNTTAAPPPPTPPTQPISIEARIFEIDAVANGSWDAAATAHRQRRFHYPPTTISISSRLCSKLRRLWNCIWYPVVFLTGILTVMTMILFCVLPGIFMIAIFFCCYYCCVRDPAPLSIWMIQLFGDDTQPSTPRKSRHEMQAMLLTRRVLSIEPWQPNDPNENKGEDVEEEALPDLTTQHRTHAGKVQLISTHGDRRLIFSDIVVDSTVVDSDDDVVKQSEVQEEEEEDEESVDFSNDNWEESETDEGSKVSTKTQEQPPPHPRVTTTGNSNYDVGNDGNHTGNEERQHQQHDIERPSSPLSVQHSQAHPDVPCCDICLVEYQKDDYVCWSANTNCVHAFHRECILDWLERKPNCPNCRRSYLVESTPTDVDQNNQDSNV